MRAFPAKKYALILRNHGGGWKGACWDDESNHDFLSMPEITSVLEATVPAGTYRAGFVAVDHAGNAAEKYKTVVIK